MANIAVFGVGSTNFRYTAATLDGEFLREITVESTRPRGLPEQFTDAVEELQESLSGSLDAVAISCTGLVDSTAGVIRELDTPAGETIDRINVTDPISEAYGLPVCLENDCNASALAEWWYGAREAHDCLVHVTFGTGIGGGIVEGGELIRGGDGQAGEFGLIPVAPQSDHESTGVTGAWEALCSGRGIPHYVAQRFADGANGSSAEDDESLSGSASFADSSSFTAKDVFEAATANNAFAEACLEEISRYNAAGIATVCNVLNPGLVTLGGGVGLNNPDWLLSGIETSLEDYLFVERPEIRLSPLKNNIGLYGALAIVRSQESELGETT